MAETSFLESSQSLRLGAVAVSLNERTRSVAAFAVPHCLPPTVIAPGRSSVWNLQGSRPGAGFFESEEKR